VEVKRGIDPWSLDQTWKDAGLPLDDPWLFQRDQSRVQPGLVTGGSVFVQNTLLDRFIQRRSGLTINFAGGGLVTLGERLTHLAESRAQTVAITSIAESASFGLAGTFKRGKMVCHYGLSTFSSGFPAELPWALNNLFYWS